LGKLRDVIDAISFQRDAWERAFDLGTRGPAMYDPQQRRLAEQGAISRIKKAFAPRRR
jgi:hypothetical protein